MVLVTVAELIRSCLTQEVIWPRDALGSAEVCAEIWKYYVVSILNEKKKKKK